MNSKKKLIVELKDPLIKYLTEKNFSVIKEDGIGIRFRRINQIINYYKGTGTLQFQGKWIKESLEKLINDLVKENIAIIKE